MVTCYDVLEVSPTASKEIIHMAYRELSRKFDPATYPGDKGYAEYKIKMINKAYSILSDPDTRKKYDLYLQRQYTEDNESECSEQERKYTHQAAKGKYCIRCGASIQGTASQCPNCGCAVAENSKSKYEKATRKASVAKSVDQSPDTDEYASKKGKPSILLIILACATSLFLLSLIFYFSLRIVIGIKSSDKQDTYQNTIPVSEEYEAITRDTETIQETTNPIIITEADVKLQGNLRYVNRAKAVAEKEYSKYLENEEISAFMQKAFANAITMDMLNRQPDYYVGKEVYFGGNVLQAIYNPENSKEVDLRIEVPVVKTSQNVVYVSYTLQDSQSRILEGDYVDMYGYFSGMITYDSVGSGPITIPHINGRKIYCYASVEDPLTTPIMKAFMERVDGNFWSEHDVLFSFDSLPNSEMNYFSEATEYGDCIVAYYTPEIGWDENNPPPFYRVTAFKDGTMVIFEPHQNAAEGVYAIDNGTYTVYTFLNGGGSEQASSVSATQPASNNSSKAQPGYVIESSGGLKIRSGPSTNYDEVGRLAPLENITITEIQSDGSRDWGKIDRGWVCMDYIVLGSASVRSSGGGYNAVLDQYRIALATNFATCGQYVGESFAYLSNWGGQFEVYYATVDLNSDGVSELIIAGKDASSGSSLENMDLFTLSGDTPKSLVDTSSLGHRSHLYIYPDGTFATSGSGGASTHMTEFHKLPPHSTSAAVTHGYGTDMGEPYYYGADINPYPISEGELYALPDASQLPQMNISWTRLN